MLTPPLPKEMRDCGRGRPVSKHWELYFDITQRLVKAEPNPPVDSFKALTQKRSPNYYCRNPGTEARLYVAGFPIGYIAKYLGIPYFLLWGHLNYEKVTLRVPPYAHPEIAHPDWLHFVYLMEGKPTKWIANQMGCSPRYTRTVLKIHNIPAITPANYADMDLFYNLHAQHRPNKNYIKSRIC